MLDFDALGKGGSGAKVIEPRKIFTTLIRNSRFKFPSANQGEVLDRWFDKRSRRDNTIKMNTGSGKMLVGLLALQRRKIRGVCGASPAIHLQFAHERESESGST
jgi:superfamily II DNA or RNA helicase